MLRGLVEGGLFGSFSIVAMADRPLIWAPGIYLDLRVVPVVLAASFVGRGPAAIAVALAVIYRLWVGGAGSLPGAVEIALAAMVGAHASRFRRGEPAHLSLIVAGSVLPILAFPLLLPAHLGLDFVRHAALPLALFNPIGCLTLCLLLDREVRRNELERVLRREADSDPLDRTGEPARL